MPEKESENLAKLANISAAKEKEIIDHLHQTLQADLQRKINYMKILLGVLLIVLGPMATYVGKVLVDRAMKEVEESIRSDLRKVELDIWNQMLMVRVLAESIALEAKPHLSAADVEAMIVDLRALSKVEVFKHSHEVELIVEESTIALIRHGMGEYLDDLEDIFPWAVQHTESINAMYVEHYAFELLAEFDAQALRGSTYYQRFQEHLRSSRKHRAEENTLPYEVLVSFHLGAQERNSHTDGLVQSVGLLTASKQATFVWKIMEAVNPHFWEVDPLVQHYRIGDVAMRFLEVYANDVQAIASSDKAGKAVEEELAEMYRNAVTLGEEHLGRFVLEHFWNHYRGEDLDALFARDVFLKSGPR